MKIHSLVITACLLTFSVINSQAQKNKNLPAEEVKVEKKFEARLLDAEKLNTKPGLPPLDTVSKALKYDVPSKNVSIDYAAPKLRPVAMKADPIPPSYKGFVKAGYGIPASPYAEASYVLSAPKQYDFGIEAKHHSANNSKLENQRFSRTGVTASGNYYLPNKLGIGAKIGYNQNNVYFYGYDHYRSS